MMEVDLNRIKWYYMLNPLQSFLVTCVDRMGKPNIITLSYVYPISSNPSRVMIGIRPENYSHSLVDETKEFVVNTPTMELMRETEYCGRRSGRNFDKFKETGLTPLPAKEVKPPIIKECVAWIECKVQNQIDFGNRTLFFGDVVAAYVKDEIFQEKMYDIKKAKMIFHIGKNRYATLSDEVVQPKL